MLATRVHPLKHHHMTRFHCLFIALAFMSGCASLHHAQLGQIDNRQGRSGKPFVILMSETGVSAEEIGQIARVTNSRAGNALGDAAAIIALFQMGPRTGNPVYSERYAERLLDRIYENCPSGQVTDLMSIREDRKYPVISGEIVKVTGLCLDANPVAQVNGVSK